MGYFFRRSARVGPFRLNFSKSGIGASVGVKGARVTMTPRGTTYVTVGSNGFYYRETLSTGGRSPVDSRPQHQVPPPPTGSTVDAIPTASASDLLDSSSERLIQQLNERARMFNPAGLLYLAAVLALGGLAIVPTAPAVPTLANLPDVTLPFSAERASNTVDEYSMLTARYGEPDSILIGEGPVPVGTARYNTALVDVVFVPVGCIKAYEEVSKSSEEGFRYSPRSKGKKKTVKPCVGSPNAGWVTIKYIHSAGEYDVSADVARSRLDRMASKRTAPPTIEARASQKSGVRPRPSMQSDSESRATFGLMKRDVAQRALSAEASAREYLYERVALMLVALGLFVAGAVVHTKNTELRTSRLFYELGEAEQQRFNIVKEALGHLAKSHRVWRVAGESSTADWKRNAGASSLVRRVPISVGRANPPRVETNCNVPSINMGQMSLFFLPDVILCWESGAFGSIAYQDLRLTQSLTRFIEDGFVPADATIVDRTWRYVNKGGGPDRRFNNNAQLPVAQYGVLVLNSSRGLNIHLNTSSAQASLAVANCWRYLDSRTEKPQERPARDHPGVETPCGPRSAAFKMLGLNANASAAEISAAYRHLAQMYHPDKVVGLAPEFQVLADKRMKEINAAYELLKERGTSAQTA
jgi:hypothetical protein